MTIWHVYGGETESPLNDLIDTFNDTIGLPPNIEELLSGFRDRVQTLTPMERTVLQYYIDGCSLEEVAARVHQRLHRQEAQHEHQPQARRGLTRGAHAVYRPLPPLRASR